MSTRVESALRLSRHARTERRAHLINETQHLLDYRATPEEICRRLNTTPSALARILYREGFHKEAAPIERLAKRLWRENKRHKREEQKP